MVRSSTASSMFSAPRPWTTVNRTASPLGRTSGQAWPVSPRSASGVVKIADSPPPAGPWNKPVPHSAKMIVSSSPQLTPLGGCRKGKSVRGGPPRMETFFHVESALVAKTTQAPSGEMAGVLKPAAGVLNSAYPSS